MSPIEVNELFMHSVWSDKGCLPVTFLLDGLLEEALSDVQRTENGEIPHSRNMVSCFGKGIRD